jgi:hypothetical protein
VNVQLEFRFHLALTVGRLTSITAGVVTIRLTYAKPVATRRDPSSVRHQSHGRTIQRIHFKPPKQISKNYKKIESRRRRRRISLLSSIETEFIIFRVVLLHRCQIGVDV